MDGRFCHEGQPVLPGVASSAAFMDSFFPGVTKYLTVLVAGNPRSRCGKVGVS
jgi:hypothetical protein